MNCREAREIINLAYDGEREVRESAAREHMSECSACREWLAGMERMMSLASTAREAIPSIEVASIVMSRLPERHPSSVAQRRVWISRRALAWMGASWAMGAMALLLIGLYAMHLLNSPSGSQQVVATYSAVRTVMTSAGVLTSGVAPLVTTSMDLVRSLPGNWLTLLVGLTFVECTTLGLVYLVWRRRVRIPDTMSVLV